MILSSLIASVGSSSDELQTSSRTTELVALYSFFLHLSWPTFSSTSRCVSGIVR